MKRLFWLLFLSLTFLRARERVAIPTIDLSLSAPSAPEQLVTSLNVLIVLTLLALASSLVFIMTSFLRLLIMISLPFKLLTFVVVDGWNLLVGNLVESFR